MNDPLTQLEAELRQLAPAPLPARVQRRLDEIGAGTPWYVVRWPVWGTALATTAVAVALLSLPATPPPSRPSKTAVTRVADCPPSVLRVLCSERDEGVVLVNQTRPYRQTRRRYVDLYTWDHCLPGTRLDYSKPLEEVVFTPITVY